MGGGGRGRFVTFLILVVAIASISNLSGVPVTTPLPPANACDTCNFLFAWSTGTTVGDYPNTIAIDSSSGNVYVTDQWNNRVEVFGDLQSTTGTGCTPSGMANYVSCFSTSTRTVTGTSTITSSSFITSTWPGVTLTTTTTTFTTSYAGPFTGTTTITIGGPNFTTVTITFTNPPSSLVNTVTVAGTATTTTSSTTITSSWTSTRGPSSPFPGLVKVTVTSTIMYTYTSSGLPSTSTTTINYLGSTYTETRTFFSFTGTTVTSTTTNPWVGPGSVSASTVTYTSTYPGTSITYFGQMDTSTTTWATTNCTCITQTGTQGAGFIGPHAPDYRIPALSIAIVVIGAVAGMIGVRTMKRRRPVVRNIWREMGYADLGGAMNGGGVKGAVIASTGAAVNHFWKVS